MPHDTSSGRTSTEDDGETDEDIPEGAKARDRFAERLEEAGLDAARFIPVQDGEKGTRTSGHQQPENWLSADASRLNGGNYGVHPGLGGADNDWWLVEFDNDDYDDETDTSAVDALPATFEVESPHTDEESPGHQYYRASEEAIAVVEELNGNLNPEPEWGEIKIEGKYVVGPGSQLAGCSKEWCDECAKPDGGYYRIANDREIATISPNDMRAVLSAESSDNADLPTVGDDDGDEDYDGPELSEEQVGEALDHVAHKLDYSSWISLGFAVHDWDDGQTGKRLFEEFSRHNGKWDSEESQRHIDDIWKNGSQSDDSDRSVSVGTLVHRAQQEGWDGPGGGPIGAPSPDNDVVNDRESDTMPKPSPTAGFVCRNGFYGYTKQGHDGKEAWEEVTNFQLEAESFLLEGDGEDSVELTVHPARHGESYTRTVPMTVFNEVRNFKKHVVTARGTAYSGGSDMLNKIRKFVGGQDAPVRAGVDHIGLHTAEDTAEWVTPNGVLTTDGWSDDPDSVLTRQDSPLANKWGLDPEDGDEYDGGGVRDILRLLPQMRPSERFLPALGWFYAAPFRPLIMNEFGEGEFNILNVVGNSGSGKSASLEALAECFGMDGEPFRADGTPFPLMKAMAATNALPIVFDEYKPADMTDYRVDNLKSYLRTSSRGGIEQKGNPDQTVNEYRLLAPVCIAGEQPLKGTAEERRSIQTAFTRRPTKKHTRTCEMFHRLTGGEHDGEYHEGYELLDHARAYYQWVLDLDHDELHTAWRDARETTTEIIDELDLSGLDELVEQGYQTVAFGMMVYRRFARDMGADIDGLPVTESDVKAAIEYLADEGTGAEHRSNVDRLLGLAGRASTADYLEHDEHYTFVCEGEEDEELVIRLQTAFDAIRKYVRDYDITGEDLLDTVEDYQSRFRDEQERENSYIVASSKKARPIGNGAAFRLGRACDRIEGLSRRMFTDSERVGGEDGEGSALEDVEAIEARDKVDLTVCVAGVEHNPPQWLDGRGTFRFGDGAKIGYQVQGMDLEIDVGREYELRDAVVGTDMDEQTVLKLRVGMTEIAPVSEDDTDADDGGDDNDGSDGGGVPEDVDDDLEGDAPPLQELCARGQMYVRDNHEDRINGVPHDDLVEHLMEHGASEEQAETVVKKLRDRGDITVPAIDHYRA